MNNEEKLVGREKADRKGLRSHPPLSKDSLGGSKAPLMDLSMLKGSSIPYLRKRIEETGVSLEAPLSKQTMVSALLKWQTARNGSIVGGGILEVFPDGYGFLREPAYNYAPSADDIYVPPSHIRSLGLRTGSFVQGAIRPPTDKERYYSLSRVEHVNGLGPEEQKRRIAFDNLTPMYPNERFNLEFDPENYSTRIVDFLTPIGKGQRALIVAPPRTGKTVLLQHLANAITANHSDVILIVLLVGERPGRGRQM